MSKDKFRKVILQTPLEMAISKKLKSSIAYLDHIFPFRGKSWNNSPKSTGKPCFVNLLGNTELCDYDYEQTNQPKLNEKAGRLLVKN